MLNLVNPQQHHFQKVIRLEIIDLILFFTYPCLASSKLSVVESQLAQSAEFDSELVRLALVVAQLLRSEVVNLFRLLRLQPLDPVESAHQARHVVLKEFHQLRI